MASSVDFDLQLAARAGLQSLHSFISLFSLHPPPLSSPSSMQQLQLQHQQSMAASDTITQFKHLGTLLSQRRGHARVRQGPRIAATTHSDILLSSPHSPPLNPNFPSGNPNPPPITPNFPSDNHNFSSDNPNFPSSNPNSLPINPNFSLCNPNLPLGNPNLASQGTLSASTSFEESNSGAFDDEGQSIRGSTSNFIDLNYQNDNTDDYEGSINKLFSRRGYSIGAVKARENYPSIINFDYNDKHNNITNNSFPAINNSDNNFDLNQQAPSLDSSPLSFTSSTKLPLFCLQPPPPPPPQESFSFDTHTQSAAAAISVVPGGVSNIPSSSSDDDEFAEFANPRQRLTVYGGHNQGTFSRQLAQIISPNPKFQVQLEKAACLIPTPTHSCISLEGSLPTYGSLPPVQLQPQQAIMASMDHKSSSAGMQRKCPSISDDSKLTKCGNNPSSKCHCAKRRKVKNKSIKRVPAISDKVSEIPHDDYSWRKYGQKPIKGSPYPRGYYKCSSVKGCPAKKHVERALDDPSMLIVTYEDEHIHSRPILEAPLPI